MYKHLFKTVLWVVWIFWILLLWTVNAEYSQIINITWFNASGQSWQLIQSFTQKRDDLELYFVTSTWSISHYTIMDRNMWATEVYNQNYSTPNTWSFWYQYQRWNNYWFEPCYEENCNTFPWWETTGYKQIPKSTWSMYVPSKYWNNVYLWWSHLSWMASWSNYDNIRWWSWDNSTKNWSGSKLDRKWPCSNWYYIPSTYDWWILLNAWKNSDVYDKKSLSNILLLPPAGYRSYLFSMLGLDTAHCWSSSPDPTNLDKASSLLWYFMSYAVGYRAGGLSVRCFKNFNNDLSTKFSLHMNGWKKTVISFTGGIWEWKIIVLKTPTRDYSTFVWWYDSATGWNEIREWDTVPNHLYAKWNCIQWYEENETKDGCIEKTYYINYNLNGWVNNENNAWTYTIKTETINLLDPIKEWYSFFWRYSDPELTVKVTKILKWSVWDKILYAKRGCKAWYVENDEKTACEKVRVEFDANGWKFENEGVTFQKEISVIQVPNFETKISHTPNLTDEWEYETDKIDNLVYYGWTYGWVSMVFYQPAYIDSVKIEWAESLNLNIKYAWNICGWGSSPVAKYFWSGEHLDYGDSNTSTAEFFISEVPSEQWTVGEVNRVVSWDSITIYKPSQCPDYGRFITVSGTWMKEVAEYPDDAFDNIPQPSRNGYKFAWWYLADGTEFNTWNISTWEVTKVYAKWGCADGYEDKWWECVKKSWWSSGWWGGGWGWGGGSPSNTVSTSSQTWSQIDLNTGSTASWTNAKEPETNTWNKIGIETWDVVDTPEQALENDNPAQDTTTNNQQWQNNTKRWWTYSPEFQQAYKFAHEKWITTMPTIEKANMDGKLTRIAMAKMLSQYAMNVLWQKPANIITPKFNDVTDKQNSDYDDWVTLAYQLWIMWQNMPWNNFRPNDEVTRAEFATALSRMAYWISDWEYKWTAKYYIHHMEKLVKEWIITKDDPNMKELRWYVMIMLMRSSK